MKSLHIVIGVSGGSAPLQQHIAERVSPWTPDSTSRNIAGTAPSVRALFSADNNNVFRPVTFATGGGISDETEEAVRVSPVPIHAASRSHLAAVLAAGSDSRTRRKPKTSRSCPRCCSPCIHPYRAVASVVDGRDAGLRILAGEWILALAIMRSRANLFLLAYCRRNLPRPSCASAGGRFRARRWKPRLPLMPRSAGVTLLYLGLLWKSGGHIAQLGISMLDIHLLLFRRWENSQRASRGVEIF